MDINKSRINSLIKDFQSTVAQHLPQLEKEVKLIIDNKETHEGHIERYLATLFSLEQHGVHSTAYRQLLEYYKKIDIDAAKLYDIDAKNS